MQLILFLLALLVFFGLSSVPNLCVIFCFLYCITLIVEVSLVTDSKYFSN
jgi:hypothetical protein